MGGRGGNWVSYAVAFLVSYVVLFVAVPFVAALFMHKGFEKYKVPDVSFRQCVQACFYAASATIVIAFLLSFVVPRDTDSRLTTVVLMLACVGVQLVLVPLLMRKRSRRAVLIEMGSVLLACLLGYGVISLLFSGTAQG